MTVKPLHAHPESRLHPAPWILAPPGALQLAFTTDPAKSRPRLCRHTLSQGPSLAQVWPPWVRCQVAFTTYIPHASLCMHTQSQAQTLKVDGVLPGGVHHLHPSCKPLHAHRESGLNPEH